MRVVLVLIIPSCLHLGPLQLAMIYHSLSTVTKINNKTTKKDVYEMGGGQHEENEQCIIQLGEAV